MKSNKLINPLELINSGTCPKCNDYLSIIAYGAAWQRYDYIKSSDQYEGVGFDVIDERSIEFVCSSVDIGKCNFQTRRFKYTQTLQTAFNKKWVHVNKPS